MKEAEPTVSHDEPARGTVWRPLEVGCQGESCGANVTAYNQGGGFYKGVCVRCGWMFTASVIFGQEEKERGK